MLNDRWREVRRKGVGARFLRALASHGRHGERVFLAWIDQSITQWVSGCYAFYWTKLWSEPFDALRGAAEGKTMQGIRLRLAYGGQEIINH
jgi:hypothetical protein